MASTGWVTIPVTTTGSAGAATGEASNGGSLVGIILAVHVTYSGDAPGTTTVTVTETGGPGRTILTLAAGNTSATYYPTVVATDTDGAAITGATWPIALGGGGIRVSVDDCDALTNAVTVFVQVLD